MPLIHEPEQAHQLVKAFTPNQWKDGVLLDIPKARRRKQAMGEKQIRINVDKDINKRFVVQVERRVGNYPKGIAWDMLCSRLEEETDEELQDRFDQGR